MTGRREGCVSTMLTESGLSIPLTDVLLQGPGATKCRMQADKHALPGAFRLDEAHVWANSQMRRVSIVAAAQLRDRRARRHGSGSSPPLSSQLRLKR